MKSSILWLFLILLCISQFVDCHLGRKVKKWLEKKNRKKFKLDPVKYLRKYGFTTDENMEEKDNIQGYSSSSLLDFQDFFGLPTTGQLDDATITLMKKPRCGREDPIKKVKERKRKGKGHKARIRVKIRPRRFVEQGTTWNPLFQQTGENKLKWTLLNTGSQDLTRDTVLKVMRIAFDLWARVTNLSFKEVDQADVDTVYKKDDIEILVSFGAENHGDPYPFDGEGGVLAHAFYPHDNTGLSGDVHFDDDELYTDESPEGRNLLWVATHEIGHSLGLDHSDVQDAVMYPYYTSYKPGFDLNEDDILGIKSLYGDKPTTTTTEPQTTTTLTTTTTTPTTTTTTPTTTTTTPTTTTTAPTTTTTTPTTTTTTPTTTTTTPTTTTTTPTTTTTTPTTTTTTPTTTTTTTTTTTAKPTTTTTTPTTTTTTPTTTTTTTTTKEITVRPGGYCPRNVKINAMFYSSLTRSIIAFTKDKKILTISTIGLHTQSFRKVFPRKINNIDAAVSYTNKKGDEQQIYFKGTTYYIFKMFEMISGPHSFASENNNPLNIILQEGAPQMKHGIFRFKEVKLGRGLSHIWSKIYKHKDAKKDKNSKRKYKGKKGKIKHVKKIDAAFTENGKLFFFSGPNYWRYDVVSMTMDSGFPKRYKEAWTNAPRKISAAFHDGNRVYLLDQKFAFAEDGSKRTLKDQLCCGNTYENIAHCKFY